MLSATTKIKEPPKETHKERILRILADGLPHKTGEVHAYCTSARTRISEINAEGKHRIVHLTHLPEEEKGKPGESWYQLVKVASPPVVHHERRVSKAGKVGKAGEVICSSGGALRREVEEEGNSEQKELFR